MCQPRPIIDQLREAMDETETLLILSPEFDAAIIGLSRQFTNPPVVIYNRDMVIEILVGDGEMSLAEAEDYFVFQIEGAYFGQSTPAFLSLVDHGTDDRWNGPIESSDTGTNPRNNC